jgi:hypothetical protein
MFLDLNQSIARTFRRDDTASVQDRIAKLAALYQQEVSCIPGTVHGA